MQESIKNYSGQFWTITKSVVLVIEERSLAFSTTPPVEELNFDFDGRKLMNTTLKIRTIKIWSFLETNIG